MTDRWTDRQTTDKVIPMCRYASQATQLKEKCDRRMGGQTDRRTDGRTNDKVIPMRRYASQGTQKLHIYMKVDTTDWLMMHIIHVYALAYVCKLLFSI